MYSCSRYFTCWTNIQSYALVMDIYINRKYSVTNQRMEEDWKTSKGINVSWASVSKTNVNGTEHISHYLVYDEDSATLVMKKQAWKMVFSQPVTKNKLLRLKEFSNETLVALCNMGMHRAGLLFVSRDQEHNWYSHAMRYKAIEYDAAVSVHRRGHIWKMG